MNFSQADGILDLRTQRHYEAGHLKNSTWLSWTLLPDSLNELPATPATLFLVGGKDEIEAATVLLDAKGYTVNGSLVIDSDEAMQQWAQALPSQVVSGSDSKRLWSPTPLLAEWVKGLTEQGFNPKALTPRPMALDVGCGGGRDTVFLAQQGWQVTGIDQELRVLKRARSLAARSKASVKFKCCNVRKQGCFPEQQFDLVVVVRYLNRALFEQIDRAIIPGGTLVYQTFVTGAEAFGSPKNSNAILEEGELSEVFSDYKIFIDRIEKLKDGRPVTSFIAQKPL